VIDLLIIGGSDKGASFRVEEPSFLVGRARTNRVVLRDPKASARHARIDRRGRRYVARDLSSTNGTFVNGRAVQEVELAEGDELRVGGTVFRVRGLAFAAARAAGRVRLSDAAAPVAARIARDGAAAAPAEAVEEADLPALVAAYRNLLVMYRVSSVLRSTADLDVLLDEVLALVFDHIRAERGAALLIDDETGELVPRASRAKPGEPEEEMAVSRTIVDEVMEKREAILTGDAILDERFGPADSVAEQRIRSAMCAPVSTRSRALGVLYVDCRSEAGRFTKADLELLTAIGNETGIAVENRLLHEANLEAERLAAVGRAVAGLSHYVKNVLTGLTAGSEIVDRALGRADVDAARKGWDIVRQNERRMSVLVLNMLSYSAERAAAREPCDVNRVVTQVAEELRPTADARGVRLGLDLATGLAPVPADPTGLHRCVLNLVVNALDAAEGREDARVRARTAQEANCVVIEVADNGPGVPEDARERVFDAFVTTKGERGTGLGLAVVKKIVTEHAGEVSVTSAPAGGAEFRLAWPMDA